MLYQFKLKIRQESEDNANDVKKEYETEMFDTKRIVAREENLRFVKKEVGKKRRIKDMMRKFEFEKGMNSGMIIGDT